MSVYHSSKQNKMPADSHTFTWTKSSFFFYLRFFIFLVFVLPFPDISNFPIGKQTLDHDWGSSRKGLFHSQLSWNIPGASPCLSIAKLFIWVHTFASTQKLFQFDDVMPQYQKACWNEWKRGKRERRITLWVWPILKIFGEKDDCMYLNYLNSEIFSFIYLISFSLLNCYMYLCVPAFSTISQKS